MTKKMSAFQWWNQLELVRKVPQLKDKRTGGLVSKTEFVKRCHIIQGKSEVLKKDVRYKTEGIRVRKYVVLFGLNEKNATWEFRFDFFCTEGKKEAIERAFEAVKGHANGFETFARFGHGESYDCFYNRKIPISF